MQLMQLVNPFFFIGVCGSSAGLAMERMSATPQSYKKMVSSIYGKTRCKMSEDLTKQQLHHLSHNYLIIL